MAQPRCIFQGELGEIRVPDLLTFLDMLGKTGTLEIRHGEEQWRRIHFERGEIVFAESSVDDEQIGEHLARNGWVAPEALATAQQESSTPEDVVKVLVRDGLDSTLLIRALKQLVLDIVYALFEWEEGRFRFTITAEPHDSKVVLKTSVANIIMEGSRRLDEWRRIREVFPDDRVVLHPAAADDAAVVSLPPIEQEVLGLADGKHDIAWIVQEVVHDRFTVLGALLTLLNAGLVSLSPAATPAPPSGLPPAEKKSAEEIVGAFNTIFAGIHERIVRHSGEAGNSRFAATLSKSAFQRSGVLTGVEFDASGRLPMDLVIANLAKLPAELRFPRLRATFDRLLAQQVLQVDTSYPAEEKKALSDLIAREKGRL